MSAVCIGDEILLTNGLTGTVEFIGHLHNYLLEEALNFETANQDNEEPDSVENGNGNDNDGDSEDVDSAAQRHVNAHEVRYGIVFDREQNYKCASLLDTDRESKYGQFGNIQRIPAQLFNNNKNLESIFVAKHEVQCVLKRKHNFRVEVDQQYVIPDALGSIYSGCRGVLQYAGYLCAHQRKTNDDIKGEAYDDYLSYNGLLQNYYVGFKVADECKSQIAWNWNDSSSTSRFCRLYPEDSRRYIHHHFTAALDGIRPEPGDDVLVFVNLQQLLILQRERTYSDPLYVYRYRKLIAMFFDRLKTFPKLYPHEKLSFYSLLECVFLRHWHCITVEQHVSDISQLIVAYIPIHFRDPMLLAKSALITSLYECGYIDKLLRTEYQFDKLCILDNETLKEIVYKNEKSLLFPWVNGHVFDTKLWLKTQWDDNIGYRAVMPVFQLKAQCTSHSNEFGLKNSTETPIVWRCGIRHGSLVIVYKFRTITVMLLWTSPQNESNEAWKGQGGLSSLLKKGIKLKKTKATRERGSPKENRAGTTTKKTIKTGAVKKNPKQTQAFPTKRYQVFQLVLDQVFQPLRQYFQNEL